MPKAKIIITDAASARRVDANGYLRIDGCPISSFGIFEYGRLQCDPDHQGENDIVNVFRPEEAVSSEDMLASFQNVPLIDDHDFLAGDDGQGIAPEDKGVDGVLVNVRYEAPWTRGDIIIYSQTMRKSIEDGKTELSLGYTCDIRKESGTFDGVEYEFVQTNMRGNHIALVDEARVKGARILDSNTVFLCDSLSFNNPKRRNEIMAKSKTLDASSVEKLKALLPALQEFLTEEEGEAQHQEGAGIDESAVEGGKGEGEEAKTVDSDVPALLKQLIEAISKATAAPAVDEEGAEKAKADELDPEKAKADELDPEKTKAGDPMLTGDAAMRLVYADQALKSDLYDRLSKHVGSFDASAMTSKDVAAYGIKKLGLVAGAGHEVGVLDAYLMGAAKAASAPSSPAIAKKLGDAKGSAEVDAYINQSGRNQ